MGTDDDVSVFVLDLRELKLKWWYVARRFEDPDEAGRSFNEMNEHAARLKGKAELAGYRLLDNLPDKGGVPRLVVVMGSIEERVREAARILDGEPCPLRADQIRGLVMRRLRFLAAAGSLDALPGVHTFQHGKGMRLDDSGRVVPMEDS